MSPKWRRFESLLRRFARRLRVSSSVHDLFFATTDSIATGCPLPPRSFFSFFSPKASSLIQRRARRPPLNANTIPTGSQQDAHETRLPRAVRHMSAADVCRTVSTRRPKATTRRLRAIDVSRPGSNSNSNHGFTEVFITYLKGATGSHPVKKIVCLV